MLISLKILPSGDSSALCYTAGVGLLAALFKTLKQAMTASMQDLLHACTRWHTATALSTFSEYAELCILIG